MSQLTFLHYIATNDIALPLINESYFKTNIKMLPFDVESESIKTFIFLLVFTFINTNKNFQDNNKILEFIEVNKNIEIYMFFKKHCVYTNECKIAFIKELNMLIPFINTNFKNTFRRLNDELIFYFPEIETDVLSDFFPLQAIILSQIDSSEYGRTFEIIKNFFEQIIKNRRDRNNFEKLFGKFKTLDEQRESMLKSVMSKNYIENHLFFNAMKKFMRHPKILELTKKQNLCCIQINQFIHSFEENLKINTNLCNEIGEELVMPIFDFGSRGNLVFIISCLVCKAYSKTLTRVNEKSTHLPFFSKLEKELHTKNFLKSAKKSKDCYNVIMQFILDCNYYVYDNKDIPKKTISLVINSIRDLTDTIYFKTLLFIYDQDFVEAIKEQLNICLKTIIKNRIERA